MIQHDFSKNPIDLGSTDRFKFKLSGMDLLVEDNQQPDDLHEYYGKSGYTNQYKGLIIDALCEANEFVNHIFSSYRYHCHLVRAESGMQSSGKCAFEVFQGVDTGRTWDNDITAYTTKVLDVIKLIQDNYNRNDGKLLFYGDHPYIITKKTHSFEEWFSVFGKLMIDEVKILDESDLYTMYHKCLTHKSDVTTIKEEQYDKGKTPYEAFQDED